MQLLKLLTVLAVLLLGAASVQAKEQLMVKNISSQRGVDKQTAGALSVVIQSALGQYYSVQSLDALAAVSQVVEEKLKAGCDDTKCLMEVAGALDIGLIVTGDISKFGDLYTLSLQLISTRGAKLGVVNRASEECECTEQQLVDLSKRVALKLIAKEPTSDPPNRNRRTFSVHVFSFKTLQAAQAEVRRLDILGFDAYIETVDFGARGIWHRVKVGHYPTRPEAEQARLDVKKKYPDIEPMITVNR